MCTYCTLGTSPNVAMDTCTVQCGDGRKNAAEACDDGNTGAGDG